MNVMDRMLYSVSQKEKIKKETKERSPVERRVMCADCDNEIRIMGDGKSFTQGTSIRFGTYYSGPAICEICIGDRYDVAADNYEST